MQHKKTTFLKSAALALALALPPAGYVALSPASVVAQQILPAPYLSRALHAVLVPVDAMVAESFGLAGGTTGVLVLAVDPNGLAAAAGIEPGDVIDYVSGEAILTPVELDEIVWYWISNGRFDFELAVLRGGKAIVTPVTVTLETWELVVDVATVASWTSLEWEGFSYSEYYAEYSEELTASYESAEMSIEEATASEAFEADMQEADEGYAEVEGGDMAGDEGADMAGDDGGDMAGDEGGDAGGDEGGDAGGDEGGGDE